MISTLNKQGSAKFTNFGSTPNDSATLRSLGVSAANAIAKYVAIHARIDGVTYVYHTPYHNLQSATAPTSTDDVSSNYAPGSMWIDKTADNVYVCVDGTIGAAVWKQLD